jgi:hypothetical protein
MTQREQEPIFCTECQNEVKVEAARVLDGKILCPADLAKRPFLDRLRSRKLPQNYMRRSGKTFQGLFTSIAALMLVIGIAFIWKAQLSSGERPQGASGTTPAAGAANADEAARAAERSETALARVLASHEARQNVVSGVVMIVASALVAIAGMFAGDVIDLLLDVRDLQRSHR